MGKYFHLDYQIKEQLLMLGFFIYENIKERHDYNMENDVLPSFGVMSCTFFLLPI